MIEELRQKLTEFNQQHLLNFIDELDDLQKKILIDDINSIQLDKVCDFFREVSSKKDDQKEIEKQLEPIDKHIYESTKNLTNEKKEYYKEIGLNAIRDGKVAILLLAGGQGTRLGVNYPKGMYDVGLPSKKTLFQLQAERLKRLQKLASKNDKHAKIYWFIMTSGTTQQTTIDYFENNQYFGLNKDQLIFFNQGTLPCFTLNGEIILKSKYEISRSPDGNGGLYDSLKNNNIIDKLKEFGIEYVHAYCVDNILVKPGDPLFLGYCIDKKADTGVKAVEKNHPHEAGEISKDLAEKRDDDGKLMYGCGNICNHFYTTDFLSKVVHERLPHHAAKKKIPFIHLENGDLIKPTSPNGIKIEKFIFDILPYSERFAVLDVIREEEFSPLKNNDLEPKDTPTTARLSIFNLHKRYIEKAGGIIIDSDENQVSICEISPLVSYDGENLEETVKGKQFTQPIHIE